MPRRSSKRSANAKAAQRAVADAPIVQRRTTWAVGGTVSVAALVLYLLTMARGLTWQNTGGDGGDFLAAAFTWGIPHPTGYPTYTVLLRLFGEALPLGSEALRGNLFSAVMGAVAVGLFFGFVWRLLGTLGTGRATRTRVGVSALAASAFATGNLFWSQATITEVYALGALFAAAISWLALEVVIAARNGRRRWKLLAAMALLVGISMGNTVTTALYAVPLGILAGYELRRGIGWSAALDWRAALALLIGLSVYSYAPIASAQDPPLNWFMPHTLNGFWEMATGALYQDYLFDVRPGFVPSRILASLDLWLTQYSVVGAILGVAGLSVLWERLRSLALATGVAAIALLVYAITYNSFDPYVYLVPAFMLFAAWMAVGLYNLLEGVARAISTRSDVPALVRRHYAPIIIGAVALFVPAWSIAFNYDHVDVSDDREAERFVEEAFDTAGPGSVILAEDIRAFSLWYQEMVAEPEADVAVVALHLLPYDWYWEHMQRRYPERMPAGAPAPGFWTERLAQVIEHNSLRPVYFADEGGYTQNWTLVEDGPLFAVTMAP